MFKKNTYITEGKDADDIALSLGMDNRIILHENQDRVQLRKKESDGSMHMERCGRA
jgi:hypothetical protein